MFLIMSKDYYKLQCIYYLCQLKATDLLQLWGKIKRKLRLARQIFSWVFVFAIYHKHLSELTSMIVPQRKYISLWKLSRLTLILKTERLTPNGSLHFTLIRFCVNERDPAHIHFLFCLHMLFTRLRAIINVIAFYFLKPK